MHSCSHLLRSSLILLVLFASVSVRAQTLDESVDAGFAAEQSQDYQAAIEHYSKAQRLEPQNVQLNDRLGLMYYKIGELDSAIRYCSMAVTSDPSDSVGYYQRGHCYLDKAEYKPALSDFEHSFDATAKRNGNSSFNIGKSYAGLKNYENAREYYRLTLTLMPGDEYSYYEIGYTFALQNMADSALYYYNKAIEQDAKYFEAYLNRGLLRAVQFKDHASAHTDLARSMEIRPKAKGPYLYDAALYNDEEEFGKAKDRLDKLIELYPDFAEGYFQRALTWYKIGILNMVCRDLDRAIELKHPTAAEIKAKICK